MKNTFLQELQDRGYLNQCSDSVKLAEICNKKSIAGYIGFDCTASSLHVGSLLQIMILKLMQKISLVLKIVIFIQHHVCSVIEQLNI